MSVLGNVLRVPGLCCCGFDDTGTGSGTGTSSSTATATYSTPCLGDIYSIPAILHAKAFDHFGRPAWSSDCWPGIDPACSDYFTRSHPLLYSREDVNYYIWDSIDDFTYGCENASIPYCGMSLTLYIAKDGSGLTPHNCFLLSGVIYRMCGYDVINNGPSFYIRPEQDLLTLDPFNATFYAYSDTCAGVYIISENDF